MTLRLPEGAFKFLEGFLWTLSFWIILAGIALLVLKAFVEKDSLQYFRSVRAIYCPWSIFYGVCTLFFTEFVLVMLGFAQYQYIILLLRNSAILLLGLWILPGVLHGEWTQLEGFFGYTSPLAGLFLVGFFIFIATGLGFWVISWVRPYSVLVQGQDVDTAILAKRVLFGVLLIPLTEELVFRGYLQQMTKEYTGAIVAVGISSTDFAAAHTLGVKMIPIICGGLIMGSLMELFGSVIPGLVVHSGFNFLLLCGGYWIQ